MPAATLLASIVSLGALGGPPCVIQGGEARGSWRPVLSGPEHTVTTEDGSLVVHWTEEGGDAIAEAGDGDGNGLPDGIDRILDGLETGTAAYLADGWRPILMDEGGGGTEAVDVYVQDIEAFGYAWSQAVQGGFSCWLALDPRNTDLGEGMAESVAAHELHHCVQYAYTAAADSWIYEATATYEQYLLFDGPAIGTALQALWSQRLLGMHRPLADTGDRYEYAGFVFVKYLVDRGVQGDEVALWESLAQQPAWPEALEAESQRKWGEPFDLSFALFAAWNLFACGRDDGQHYDPATHPCLLEGNPIPIEELDEVASRVEFVAEEATHTAAHAELWARGDSRPIELSCAVSPEEARAVVVLVEVDGWGAQAQEAIGSASAGEPLVVRLDAEVDSAGSFGIAAASVGAVPARIECDVARVEPILEEPAGIDQGCSCRAGGRRPPGLVPGVMLAGLAARWMAGGRCRRERGCGSVAAT